MCLHNDIKRVTSVEKEKIRQKNHTKLGYLKHFPL